MPVYSMTGYASSAIASAGATISGEKAMESQLSLEIRSVNSRFLDISFRLSEELRQAEPALRSLITKNIKRGKIEVRAALESKSQNLLLQPSSALLDTLLAIQKDVQLTLKDAHGLSVADVIRLSGAQSIASPSTNSVEHTAALLSLTETALADLLASRESEGARLTKMLLEHIKLLRALVSQADPLIPTLVAQQRQKFLDRWREALNMGKNLGNIGNTGHTASSDNKSTQEAAEQMAMDRALSEATAFAIRIDVAEELTRLSSHLEEIEQILQKGGETGKKLDFLIQELHREANTLGSKSSVLEISRISVDMKVLIEQMREQVQNLE